MRGVRGRVRAGLVLGAVTAEDLQSPTLETVCGIFFIVLCLVLLQVSVSTGFHIFFSCFAFCTIAYNLLYLHMATIISVFVFFLSDDEFALSLHVCYLDSLVSRFLSQRTLP